MVPSGCAPEGSPALRGPGSCERLARATAWDYSRAVSPDGHRMVFLGGLHRSGTTFVARSLAAHPQVSGFSGTGVPEDEGEHLQSVYTDCWELGGVGRFGFSERAHLTETSPLVSASSRETLWAEWSRWWDLERPLLIEKSPPNMLKMRFLQALFPEARFVMIIRHPVAVMGATLKWRSRLTRDFAPEHLLRHWLHCHQLARFDAPHIRRLHVLRYEDLISGSSLELDRLASFLELEQPIPNAPVEARHNERYFDTWRQMKQNPLRRGYIEWVERRHRDALREFGYEFGRPEPVMPISSLAPTTQGS